MDGPEPIEIELTPLEPRHDREHRWRRDAGTDPSDRATTLGADASEPSEAPMGPDPSAPRADRTRLLVTAGVVGVLALALGWLVGRAGADDGLAVDRAPSTTAPPTTLALPFPTLPIDGEEIGEPDFEQGADEPAVDETVRSTTVTTTVEIIGPTTEPIEVDPRLLGTPIRLVGAELGGVLVEADLAAGTLTDFGFRRIASDGSGLTVGPDWVLAGSNRPSRVLWSDGSETEVDIGEGWRPLHVPGTDMFWRTPFSEPIGEQGLVLSLVDVEGEPVGPEIELPLNAWPYLVDPATGGVIVANVARNYAITPDGAEYLGLGELIGVSESTVVMYDCDEAFVCSLHRTERATGEVTVVPADAELSEELRWSSLAGWGPGVAPTISADGRWLSVFGQSWHTSVVGIIELDTGRFVELTSGPYSPSVVWSPDSRYAFTLDGQRPMAYDTVTDDRFEVFTDGTQWVQIGARPASSAPAEEPVEG